MDGLLFNNAIFYVMSGTGNTYRMACQMKEIAHPYMEDIKIVMIDESDAESEPTPSKDTLVGFLFSTHGFMPPWSMIKFLLRMRRQNLNIWPVIEKALHKFQIFFS